MLRVLRFAFLPVSAAILTAAALLVPLPYFAERPGLAVALGDCVDVEKPAGELTGDFLLLTINVREATVFDLVSAWFDPHVEIVGRASVVPAGVDSDVFFQSQRDLFSATADTAAVVALRGAGFRARLTGDGALVVQVIQGSPADGVLAPGDVVTAVNGAPIRTDEALRRAVRRAGAGDPLALRVQRADQTLELTLTPLLAEGRALIGVRPQTASPRAVLPFDVTVRSGQIGGPSAGLMIALTTFDEVSDADLAAGRLVAGTGSLDAGGNVGPIGGIRLKVLAAERAGADVFVSPHAQAEVARASVPAGAAMTVLGAATFDEARTRLLEDSGTPAAAPQPRPCPYAEQSR